MIPPKKLYFINELKLINKNIISENKWKIDVHTGWLNFNENPILNKSINNPDMKRNIFSLIFKICNGIKKGIINKNTIIEVLTGFKRAGANAVVTYFANQIAKHLK